MLIVDDDAASRRLLDVRLRALGCQVSTASNGQQALSEISKEEPALLLLDYQMPGMDGMAVLRELRKAGVDLPRVIVVTAHGSIETAVEAMKEGAYDSSPSRSMRIILISWCARSLSAKDSKGNWSFSRKRPTSAIV